MYCWNEYRLIKQTIFIFLDDFVGGLWCLMPLSNISVDRSTRENHQPAASYWQTWSHNVVSSTPRLSWIRTHNVSSDRHWLLVVNRSTIRSRPWRPLDFVWFSMLMCFFTIRSVIMTCFLLIYFPAQLPLYSAITLCMSYIIKFSFRIEIFSEIQSKIKPNLAVMVLRDSTSKVCLCFHIIYGSIPPGFQWLIAVWSIKLWPLMWHLNVNINILIFQSYFQWLTTNWIFLQCKCLNVG